MPARSHLLSTLPPEQDDFEWSKVKYFVLYVLAFALGTWTNMKVLQTANVETVIVFRSCCPIVVAGFDFAALLFDGLRAELLGVQTEVEEATATC